MGRTDRSNSERRDAEVTTGSVQIAEPTRLNRYIAMCGVASRRKADELITGGLVSVNGVTVEQLGTQVKPGDEVVVNGRLLTPRSLSYVLLNKPTDTITTRSDERGRRTVMDLVGKLRGSDSLYPVGRLDRDTTGALIITNDGELANRLMHPRYEVTKIYVVRTRDAITDQQLDQLRDGLELEDGPVKPTHVARPNNADQKQVAIALHEGRNHIVRRMIAALGHEVAALDRTTYGGIGLDGVRRGKWRHLTDKEVRKLYRQAGLKQSFARTGKR